MRRFGRRVAGRWRTRFDGGCVAGIHRLRPRGLALGLTLRATLGIPRSSVGPQAICVGSNGLALALAARAAFTGGLLGLALCAHLWGQLSLLLGIRRTLGTDVLRLAARTAIAIIAPLAAALAATTARSAARTTARSAGARTTRTAWATSAARTTAGTAGTAGTATASIATRTAARTTAPAFAAHVARRARELPADAGAWHLAATGTIILLGVVLLCAGLQAAEAAGLVATVAAGTTATTATTATAATVAAAAAVVAIIAATPLRRPGDAIDRVVKLAARDRAVRRLLALEDAHEPHLIDAIADDVERFEQPRRAIGLQLQLVRDGLDRRIGRRCSGRVGRRLATLGGRLGLRSVLDRRCRCRSVAGFRRRHAVAIRRRCRRRRGRRGGRRRRLGTFRDRANACADLRRPAQGQRRELGQCLHGR